MERDGNAKNQFCDVDHKSAVCFERVFSYRVSQMMSDFLLSFIPLNLCYRNFLNLFCSDRRKYPKNSIS